jgi:hypothetical protein
METWAATVLPSVGQFRKNSKVSPIFAAKDEEGARPRECMRLREAEIVCRDEKRAAV